MQSLGNPTQVPIWDWSIEVILSNMSDYFNLQTKYKIHV